MSATVMRDLTAEQATRAAVYTASKEDPCAGWIRPCNDPLVGQLSCLIYGAPMYKEMVIDTHMFTAHSKIVTIQGPAAYRTQQYRLLDGQVLRREVELTRQAEWNLVQWEETWASEWRVFDSALDGYIEVFEAMLLDFQHRLNRVTALGLPVEDVQDRPQAIDKWARHVAITSIERTEQIIDLLRALRQQDRILNEDKV